MKNVGKLAVRALLVIAFAGWTSAPLHAIEPHSNELDTAIKSGDFSWHLTCLTARLNEMAPAGAGEAALTGLLKDPAFANTLNQRQLISKTGVEALGAFARTDAAHREFLAGLLRDTQAMDLYLEAVVPLSNEDREENRYKLTTATLEIWKKIVDADPDAKQGLYQKLAIATAIAPGGVGGTGSTKSPIDPVERYQHFKTAHKNKELFPSFNHLTVWEYTKIVSAGASNADLAWAREAINTWRPDLRAHELVVNSTSEVWRRNSPHPYEGYASVLEGGGKCGPRSSWSVMVCQAFGIPAIGVSQPAHACVAYKSADPMQQPQPGSVWKVGYGRGWEFSKVEGVKGPDFLVAVEERSHAATFSQVEHLRWLASALASKDSAAAVMAVAHKIQKSTPTTKTDLTASANASEADAELTPEIKPAKATAPITKGPVTVTAGVTRIDAAACTKMSGVILHDSYKGGKQINFQKSVKESWVEYTLDVPVSGTYALVLTTAAANVDQTLDVAVGGANQATISVPNSTGLWAATSAVDVKLEQGRQTLRLTSPFQRGVAVKSLELKAKG